ncbi:Hat2p Ecym_3012 [Eremothecium cymbalariae DBVPG|uniref:Histone-binding protein RBBP4-like N-terminal domain-containing protein n=1 Tax=Eremothecium cymbalariae (strain CBS 270.75 / DBVPG 7215 / KCTC 17166 / NRRL Y-17582) TaxID=931890 RepID=G8JQW2_ERECY|nr:Hypothetical protein Ecym_3012 [Eremothecium cymbalariae DBVPG\
MMEYEEIEHDESPLTVDQEYELWKSNVSLMYDFVSETKLTWPSLSIQWLPSVDANVPLKQQEMILGTHTSGDENNYLKIAAIDLPYEVVGLPDEDNSSEPVKSMIKVTKKFEHEDEVIRARYMPKNDKIIATINGKGKIFIYDRSKSKSEGLCKTLSYHKDNGYGLAFNPQIEGELLSASDDTTVALWDINSTDRPVSIVMNHTDIVNDSKWHEFDENIFGTVSEDKTLQVHDKRSLSNSAQVLPVEKPLNALAFSKHSKNLIAAAGTDTRVYLYDLRRLSEPLHTMAGHQDAVTSIEFSSHKDGILCSSGSDRRLFIWDLTQIGAEQAQEDADDGVPELMMMHAGHRSAINDFSFNPQVPWLIASAEEDNVVQVWKISKKLVSNIIPEYTDLKSLE